MVKDHSPGVERMPSSISRYGLGRPLPANMPVGVNMRQCRYQGQMSGVCSSLSAQGRHQVVNWSRACEHDTIHAIAVVLEHFQDPLLRMAIFLGHTYPKSDIKALIDSK